MSHAPAVPGDLTATPSYSHATVTRTRGDYEAWQEDGHQLRISELGSAASVAF